MSYKRYQITRHEIYYIGLFLYVLAINVQYSYAHNGWAQSGDIMLRVLSLMKYAAYLLCITHFLTTRKLSTFAIITAAGLFAAAIYATHTGPQRAPVFYFVLIVTAIGTNFRKCVKIFLSIQLTTFILYVSLSLLGLMGSGTVNEYGRMRSFLGYGWVNRASYSWFFICLEILYLRQLKVNLKIGIILGLVNYFVFCKTNTVFSMSMTFGVIGIGLWNYYFSKLRKKRQRKIKYETLAKVAIVFFMLTLIIGIVLPIVYDPSNPVMNQFNRMVTGRLELGKTAIARYGLHLGGNKLQWVGASTLMFGLSDGSEYFYVDNGFLQLALEFGLLFTAFVIYLYLASINKACKLKNTSLVIIMMILGLLFVFEPYTIDFAFNPFILYFFSTIDSVSCKQPKT